MNEQELLDILGRHQAHSHRYGTGVINKILKQLDRADTRITLRLAEIMAGLSQAEINELIRGNFTTRRLIKMRDEIREMGNTARRITNQQLQGSAKEFIDNNINFTEKLNAAALGASGVEIGAEFTRPGVAKVLAAANALPILGRHVRGLVRDLDTDTRRRVMSEIRDGFVTGDSTDRIVRRIRGTATQNFKDGALYSRNRGIETLVRTSLTHYGNAADQATFEALGTKKLRWVSVLDSRTSKICAARDGNVYPVRSGPRPPAHPNCRSTMVDARVSLEGARRPFVRGEKKSLGKMTKKEREAAKVGTVPASTDYESWLKRQPASFQREWLGPTKYKLFKSGKFPLKRFSDPRTGREYTIDELRSRDADAFRQAFGRTIEFR